MATFRANTPTLALYIDGKLVKFVAHQLEVEDDQAEAVEDFAKMRPQYGIERVEEASEADQDAPKRETVDEVMERVGTDPDAAMEALVAEQDSDEPRTTLIAKLEAVIEAADDEASKGTENQE